MAKNVTVKHVVLILFLGAVLACNLRLSLEPNNKINLEIQQLTNDTIKTDTINEHLH